MVNDLSLTNASLYESLALKSNEAKTEEERTQLGQTEFLSLITAELNHQDPLKPMDNTQFVSQMAQISSTSGIAEMQLSINNMVKEMQSNRALEASVLVGSDVYTSSDKVFLASEGGSAAGAVALDTSTQSLNVKIISSAGELLNTVPLGAQEPGNIQFQWDGMDHHGNPVPAGSYQVLAEARVGNQTLPQDTLARDTVSSVNLKPDGGMSLNLAGLGEIGLSSIVSIG